MTTTDSLGYTEGSGAEVATDRISGIDYQIVKLAVGADGEVLLVPSGAQLSVNSIPVVLAADQEGGGQKLMANSIPVVLAYDHSAVPISGGDAVGVAPTSNPFS